MAEHNAMCAQGLQKNKHGFIQQSFYLLNASAICTIFLKLNKVLILMVLLFYEKCMLEKVKIQRTPQFADFSLLSKEPG